VSSWSNAWGNSWGSSWGAVTSPNSWGSSWGNAWGSSWGATTVIISAQSRAHKDQNREEVPVSTILVEKTKVILIEKPKIKKEDLRKELLKFLEEENIRWRREYQDLLDFQYELVLRRKKEEEEVMILLFLDF